MVEEKVRELLAPVITSVDAELVEVKWENGSLVLIVDQEDGVSAEKLASVSRLVSPLLDQHDMIGGKYTLEVTSPGLERPLRTFEHFEKVIGKEVLVKLSPHNVPKRLQGKLIAATDSTLTVKVTNADGNPVTPAEEHVVDFFDVTKAQVVFDWRGALGGGTPRNKQSKRKK